MKKFLLFISMTALSLTSNAQVQVSNDGRVYLNSSYQVNRASVTAGNSSSYSFSSSYKFGLYGYAHDNTYSIGVRGTAEGGNSSNRAIGVQGIACYSTTFNCGVLGAVNDASNYGVGVFGTLSDYQVGMPIYGRYAGYFYGATKVDGTMTATQFVTPSDIRLKENVASLSAANTSGSTLDDIMNMDVIEYNYKDMTPQDDSDTATVVVKKEINQVKQKHFGLSAQELQKIYPNLVVEGQDGYLGVNYMELVPVLIRSIQELKQELDEAKATGARTRGTTDISDAIQSQCVLYQNSPNPFKENTIIRFKLADDIQSASICVFDMQGKMLRDYQVSSGTQNVSINGYDLPKGLYLYSLIVNGKEVDTKKMILM